MKKTIFAILITLLILFCGCGNKKQENALNSNFDEIIETSDISDNSSIEKSLKVEIPYFEGFKAMPIFYLNKNEIILCYIKFGSDKQTKISLYNTETEQFKILYEGNFYISATDSTFLATQKGFMLQIGPNKLIFDKESLAIEEVLPDIGSKVEFSLYDPNFKYTIEEESRELYLIDNNTNARSKLDPPQSRYKTSFKFNPNEGEFIYLADHFNVVVYDTDTKEFTLFKCNENYPPPNGLVDYLDVYYTDDNEGIILHGACENNTAYQILDKKDGSLIATYECENDTILIGTYSDYIIFASGEKDSQEIVLFDYKNQTTEALFSLEGEFFCGGTVNSETKQIALITLKDDQQYLILDNITK